MKHSLAAPSLPGKLRRFICAEPCLALIILIVTNTMQEAEKRLKEIMAGKRPSSTLATANGTAAGKKQGSRQQRPAPYVFQAKVQLEDETRSMHMTGQVTFHPAHSRLV